MKIEVAVQGSYPLFTEYLKLIIGPGMEKQSLIDLCAHTAPVTKTLPFQSKVYVDVNPQAYPGFVQADVLGEHPVFESRYNVSTCLDGIEHMHKPMGMALLDRMMKISEKQILFTPLDPWCVDPSSTDPEAHKCVWKPEELPNYASIVLPNWHPSLGIGAFFFWRCSNLAADFERVKAGISSIKN